MAPGLTQEWGACHLYPCPGDAHHLTLTLTSFFTKSDPLLPLPLSTRGPAGPGLQGWAVRGRPWRPGAGRGQARTARPQLLWLWCRAQERRRRKRVRAGRGGRAGREVLRLSLWQSFFFLFSPFSYVKSAQKLNSLFAMVSSVSWGWGGEETPGLAPQLATEGGLILLRNESQFKYQTKNRAWRTALTVAKSLPEWTASINKKSKYLLLDKNRSKTIYLSLHYI